MTNGLCTLTQAFAGEGSGIAVSHSVSQIFSIHTFTAEPITSETDSDGYVYNPSGIPVGGTSKFKVGLDPMTGVTEDYIRIRRSIMTHPRTSPMIASDENKKSTLPREARPTDVDEASIEIGGVEQNQMRIKG